VILIKLTENIKTMIKQLCIIILVALFWMACSPPEPTTLEEFTTEYFQTLPIEDQKAKLLDFKNEIKSGELKIQQYEKIIVKADPNFTGKREIKPKLVSALPVEIKDFETFIEVTGNVTSIDDIRLSAEASGQITELYIKEGQYVKVGDIILKVDDNVIQKNIAELSTQLELARTVYQKRKNLWDQNIGSEIEFIQSRTNVEALENQIETINANRAKYTQFATAAGLVENLYVNKGEIVSPGSPVADVINLSKVKVEAELTETYLGKVKEGDYVTISVPTSNYEKSSRILEISTRINPGSRTFKIEMDVSNPSGKLKPNSLAYIKLRDYFEKDAIIVPTNLIQYELDETFVYIMDNLSAKKVLVETGETFETETIITNGLSGNEILINKGYNDVVDGQKLALADKNNNQ